MRYICAGSPTSIPWNNLTNTQTTVKNMRKLKHQMSTYCTTQSEDSSKVQRASLVQLIFVGDEEENANLKPHLSEEQ